MIGKRKVIVNSRRFLNEIIERAPKSFNSREFKYDYDCCRNKLVINFQGSTVLEMFITGEYELTITKIAFPKDVRYQMVPINYIMSLLLCSKEITILNCSDEKLVKFLEDEGFEVIHGFYERNGHVRRIENQKELYWNEFHDYDFFMIS